MYYLLIVLSVLLFGGCFALNDVYRKLRGDSLKISLQFTLISSFFALIVLIIINGFKPEFTWFTVIMALLAALDNLAYSFFSFKALSYINLSLFSMFSMLGGMLLPFLQGIIFYREPITLSKVICVILITVSLLMTVGKSTEKNGFIYYAGIFVLNGMSGVLSKIFSSAPYEKTSDTGYSMYITLFSIVLSFLALVSIYGKKNGFGKTSFKSVTVGGLSGITSRLANLFLIVALSNGVDASVQYPMVTGGVMIVSTAICFFGDNKPSKKDVLSVIVAFAGLFVLFALPV